MQGPATSREWCAQAWRAHGDGHAADAEAWFRRALAIDPASPAGLFGLATVLLDRGDLAGATVAIDAMAAIASDRPETLWLRARLAGATGQRDIVIDCTDLLLRDRRLGAEQRAEALLMRGLALGDLGDAAAAFQAAADGKAIQRAVFAAQAADHEGEIAKLRRLGGWLAAAGRAWPPLPIPQLPGAAATHVFLIGFPRSGTTLLEQMLAAHPRVATLEEAPTLAAAYQAFLSDADACAALDCLETDEAAAWVEHYWAGVRGRGVATEGRVFVDKQPAATLWLPLIARLFPRARILFAVRDPRDVVASCFRQAFQINAMTYAFTDLGETAACYDACLTLAVNARRLLPLAWADVRHEALVDDPTGEIAKLLAILNLDPDPAVAAFAQLAQARTIRTPSANQVRAGINRQGLGRWRQFERELAPVLPLLAPWVERLGYAP